MRCPFISPLWMCGSAGQVESRANNAAGIDPVIAIYIVERTGLPEAADPQCYTCDPVDSAQERKSVRVTIENGHHRRGAVGGKDLIDDPGGGLTVAVTCLHSLEQ